MAFFFILGAFTGFLFTNFPRLIPYPSVDKYSPEEFVQVYPEVKWVGSFLQNVPLLWFVAYIFLFMFLPQILKGPGLLFSLSFWFMGGISLLDGLFEIATYISPERRMSMNRGSTSYLICMSLGDSVRRYGAVRTVLVLLVGFALPSIIQLTTS
jgi:hypothetical protein